MRACDCAVPHQRRRVVLTGGPGAGKTAVPELVRILFCTHVKVLPEAAGIVYGGGFPRIDEDEVRRASQRAIFHVQRELEATGVVGAPCVVFTVDADADFLVKASRALEVLRDEVPQCCRLRALVLA